MNHNSPLSREVEPFSVQSWRTTAPYVRTYVPSPWVPSGQSAGVNRSLRRTFMKINNLPLCYTQIPSTASLAEKFKFFVTRTVSIRTVHMYPSSIVHFELTQGIPLRVMAHTCLVLCLKCSCLLSASQWAKVLQKKNVCILKYLLQITC